MSLVPAQSAPAPQVVIYGATSSGVIAAVQTARLGKRVVLIEPGWHVGGMTASGLGCTDVGRESTIGGLTRDFYRRIRAWYQDPAHWRFQTPEAFAEKNKGKRITNDVWFVFEPRAAEQTYLALLAEHHITPVFGERLDRAQGVRKDGNRIVSIRMESGREFSGGMFLDCSYEGDLLAAAGVSCTVGREANATYGELINGMRLEGEPRRGTRPLDPWVTPGDPASGLIRHLVPPPTGSSGDADARVQAYNFRLCLTSHPDNRVPFAKPDGYDERDYELLFRWLEAGGTDKLPLGTQGIPNAKTDSNKGGWISTDYVGQSDAYPEADYPTRERIRQDHIRYTKGLLWTLAHHPRVPEAVRRHAASLGYAKDEFTDHDHFPHQLYVREARRMKGPLIMTEHEVRGKRPVPDPVALGSYGMDAHITQLWVDNTGALHADELPWTGVKPYGISYRSLIPNAGECSNLLVPVCLSASHSAYGSLRMEPVYMMLGESAATAACLALDAKVSVQELDYPTLRRRLESDGQILAPPRKR